MALIENWLPPSRENWERAVYLFQFFPLVTIFQWIKPINDAAYGAGKTSGLSRFNIPGKTAWITMEVPGFISLLYCMNTIPAGGITSLPLENKVMGTMFVIHYLYRAILAPLIAPSMSPINLLVWALAVFFQVSNGIGLGGYLGGYGPTTRLAWQTSGLDYKVGGRMEAGMMIWALGLLGNIFHDDELREIRRAALHNQKVQEEAAADGSGKDKKKGVDKVYQIPENGLFKWIFYPHYLCEWIEWGGFYLMAGSGCVPARNFLLNEIATMLPRAVQGKEWYEKRFGLEKTQGRKAIIPGIL